MQYLQQNWKTVVLIVIVAVIVWWVYQNPQAIPSLLQSVLNWIGDPRALVIKFIGMWLYFEFFIMVVPDAVKEYVKGKTGSAVVGAGICNLLRFVMVLSVVPGYQFASQLLQNLPLRQLP